jgi:uncharacterized protein YdhG (YjbR/CyaY superfamily)
MTLKSKPGAGGPVKNVDDYIAAAPGEARAQLAQLREVIRAAAPAADETISYGMPFYKYDGVRVSFAAFKQHIGFFGVASVIPEYQRELEGYHRTEKGSIHFPIGEPLPVALIEKLVKARIEKEAAGRKSVTYGSIAE